MTTSSRWVRALVAGLALSVLAVTAGACVASDNGGVIQGPATTLPTSLPGATTATTTNGTVPATLPGG